MDIEKAKAILIAEILAKLELAPTKESETDAIYFSPLRNEKTPSFHVNKELNVWYDHGENKGGNAFDLVIEILKAQGYPATPSDALRWIRNTNLDPSLPKVRDVVRGKRSKWKLLSVAPLSNRTLIHYVEHRGVNIDLAKKYLTQIDVRQKCSLTKVYALGFKNEDGGYEMRNSFFKSCVSPKTITFIRADKPKPKGVMIFEGFMDFLTYATIKNDKLASDVIVLNSVACVDHAMRYIRNYGYEFAYTWMDNDKAGERAQQRLHEFLSTEPNLIHKPMNYAYEDHNDLNAWHMHNLNLK